MHILPVFLFTSLASAQFAFRVEDTDVTNIYRDIQAMWVDWAAAGNQVLESASADGLTDAWSQLASIYGATSMPALYNDAMARNAATALAQAQKHGPATIWDPDAGDHAQYSFAVRDISMASGGNDESHPATATTVSSRSSSATLNTQAHSTSVATAIETTHTLQTTDTPTTSASACRRCQKGIYRTAISAIVLVVLFHHVM